MDGINYRNVQPYVNNPHGNFDLTHTNAFDFKFGDLVPALVLPVMPGDKIDLSADHLLRFAPFISQVYQTYKLSVSYFYVPNRILFDDFDNYMSGGFDGNTEYVEPYINIARINELCPTINSHNSIFDFMNIPLTMMNDVNAPHIKALPFMAYCKVILDYYLGVGTSLNKIVEMTQNRGILDQGDCTDQFVQMYLSLRSGNPDWFVNQYLPPDGQMNFDEAFGLIKRLYPLDYFTMSRPNPQLGPVMTIPLQLVSTDPTGQQTFKINGTGLNAQYNQPVTFTYLPDSDMLQVSANMGANSRPITVNGSVFNNTATINDFYSAARIQQLLTMYGYTGFTPGERIAAEYGVKNSDLRLHRSQLLRVDYEDIQIGEVFSNNVNMSGNTPAPTQETADIPGVGTAVAKHTGGSRNNRYDFSEFGWIIGLVSVYPEASYWQGVPRYMLTGDRFDYPHPLLSELGMQDTKNMEIYYPVPGSDKSDPKGSFAYNSRYSEYKVMTNRTHGNLNANLKYLTNGRVFSEMPVFNDEFLRVDPDYNQLNRTFNVVTDFPHDQPLFGKFKFNLFANRALPYYGLPKY